VPCGNIDDLEAKVDVTDKIKRVFILIRRG